MAKYTVDSTIKNINFSEKEEYSEEYENCDFFDCNFAGCNLSNLTFEDCTFENCDLSNVQLNNTAFKNIHFKSCKLTGAQFDTCNTFLLEFKFTMCILSYSSFYALKIPETNFTGCSITEADFTDANLEKAVFENCDLSGSTFVNTNLQKTDFRSSINFSIDPEQNKLSGAKFSLESLPGLLHKYDIRIE